MVLEFKTQAQPGKKPKCSRGYPCGGSCINRQRNCKKKLRGQRRDYADWLKRTAAAAVRTKKNIKPSASGQSPSVSIDRGFSPDSKANKRLNARLEKELESLYAEAKKRANKNSDLYKDNREIIYGTKISHAYNPEGTRIARSASGKIEAVASFQTKDKSVYIDYLATAPKNVDRDDPGYTRGSGTKMIIEAVKESIEKGKKGVVTLVSLSAAEKFYEKLGFEKTRTYGTSISLMTLSRENAQKLLDLSLNFEELSLEDELEILELEAKGAFAGRK